MNSLMQRGVVCLGVVYAVVASAAPAVDVDAEYQRALSLDGRGEHEQALRVLEEGLVGAPQDLQLLGLKGAVLLKLRDYRGALAVYQAYLDAGAAGENRRQAQKIVDSLGVVESTSLEIELANGPADLYLDSKTLEDRIGESQPPQLDREIDRRRRLAHLPQSK